MDSGDTVLADHFKTDLQNTTYCSKTIQNELISCCGEALIEKIVDEVKESNFYVIMADEVQDCSNKEQMLLILRYVGQENKIKGKFIKFIVHDTGLTG